MDSFVREKLGLIRFVVFDFDGVFTDNMVYLSENGEESIRCNRSDGLGLKRLRELGIDMMILSSEVNPVVALRAAKLKLDSAHAVADKSARLDEERRKRGLEWSEVAYVGNDINDAGCLELAGLGVLVADAFDEVKPLADLVLSRSGGNAAVREFCDLIWMERSNG